MHTKKDQSKKNQQLIFFFFLFSKEYGHKFYAVSNFVTFKYDTRLNSLSI